MEVNLSSLSDEELMDLYKGDDYQAFEELYRRNHQKVHSYLSKRLGNDQAVSDVFQNIFIKLHKSRARYDSKHLFVKWLYTLSRNELLDYLKKPVYSSVELLEESFGGELSDDENVPSININIDAEKKLTANEKAALKMRYFSDYEFSEISEKLGVTSSNARKLISRGLEKLRTKYRGES